MTLFTFCIGFGIGTLFGVFTSALLIAGKDEDNE